MTTPANTPPRSPLDKMIISAECKEAKFSHNCFRDSIGCLTYWISFDSFTIKIATMGNKSTILQEALNNILSKNPIPKNNTKNRIMEISKTGNAIPPKPPLQTNTCYYVYFTKKWKKFKVIVLPLIKTRLIALMVKVDVFLYYHP
jgi:hypothetical protein